MTASREDIDALVKALGKCAPGVKVTPEVVRDLLEVLPEMAEAGAAGYGTIMVIYTNGELDQVDYKRTRKVRRRAERKAA